MAAACSSPSVRLKKLSKIRPDSQKIELLTIPETIPENDSVRRKAETPIRVDSNEVNVNFRNIGYSVKEGFFKRRTANTSTQVSLIDLEKTQTKSSDIAIQTYGNALEERQKETIMEACQTTSILSSNSPRKGKLKRHIHELEKQLNILRGNEDITLEDVHKSLKKTYPEEFVSFFTAQLDLVNKSPKGSRYTNEIKQFALSLYFLGPKKKKVILDNVNGDFCSGELTAIMGPSGSGKTSLMNILAGYTTNGVTGKIYSHDVIRDEKSFRRKSCYIMQDDNLHPLLTVQEAMTIAANLKLPQSLSTKEKASKIKEILDSMNLWTHRKVRSESLSGGQKKRLSIALELLKDPQVMFFDEPTSGLDSLSSKQCVMLLKELAAMGRTIICTIHQPSAMIFDLFDHLYVVAKGKCMYQGSIKGLVPYLEEVNLRCPTYHNPADFLLEVVNGEHGDYFEVLVKKSRDGLNEDWRSKQTSSLQLHSMDHIDKLMKSGMMTPVHAPKITFPKAKNCDKYEPPVFCLGSYSSTFPNQIAILLRRTFLIISRDRTLMYSRLTTHLSIALFIGFLYFGIGEDASNMLNNFNHIFFSVMFLMLTAFNCVTTTFPSELPIITREHFNKWYSLKSYYLAITLADIPVQVFATLLYGLVTYFLTKQPVESYRILLYLFMCVLISLVAQSFGLFIGACMDIKNGVIFGPFCFLPFTIFSGFFVQFNDCHPYMRWLFHISYLKYGFEGLVLSVLGYERPKLPCTADYCQFVNPKKFLSTMGMENATYSMAVIFLLGLFVVLRIGAYFALLIQIRTSRGRKS